MFAQLVYFISRALNGSTIHFLILLIFSISFPTPNAHGQSPELPQPSAQSAEQCEMVTESDPPFLIMKGNPSVQRQIQTDNGKFVDGYYPAGTLVKVSDTSIFARYIPGSLLSVKVLSVPTERVEYTFTSGQNSYSTTDLDGRGRRARIGDTGQIASTDLWINPFSNTDTPDNMVFQVRQDATRFNIPGIEGRAVRLAKHQGNYLTKRCCEPAYAKQTVWETIVGTYNNLGAIATYPHSSSRDPRCRYSPVFQLLKNSNADPSTEPQLVVEQQFSPQPSKCDEFTSLLQPISSENLRTVFNLAAITARLSDEDNRLIQQTAWNQAIARRGHPPQRGNVSKSLCAQAVRQTLTEVGLFHGELGWPNEAIEYHTEGYLTKQGFQDVTSLFPTPDSAPASCVLVYSGGESGHIEIKVGTNGYCSDYCSNTPITENPRLVRKHVATYCPKRRPKQ